MAKIRSITIEYEDVPPLYISPQMIDQMLKAESALILLNQATQIAKRLNKLQDTE